MVAYTHGFRHNEVWATFWIFAGVSGYGVSIECANTYMRGSTLHVGCLGSPPSNPRAGAWLAEIGMGHSLLHQYNLVPKTEPKAKSWADFSISPI